MVEKIKSLGSNVFRWALGRVSGTHRYYFNWLNVLYHCLYDAYIYPFQVSMKILVVSDFITLLLFCFYDAHICTFQVSVKILVLLDFIMMLPQTPVWHVIVDTSKYFFNK